MNMKFQFGEIKFWRWLHMNNEKQYILHSISLTTQKEKIIIQQTPRLWTNLCHSQTPPTQKHVLTANLKHRCLPAISSLTNFMNYKLYTWKRLFCTSIHQTHYILIWRDLLLLLFQNVILNVRSVFYSLCQTKLTTRKLVFCTKYLQGPSELSDWRHSGHSGAACWRTQKEARRQRQGMPACVRRRSRTRMCECL